LLTWSNAAHGQATGDTIGDEILRSLQIPREALSKSEPLRTAIADAVRCFREGDGDGLWRAMQLVHDAHEPSVDVETLMARLLGANGDQPQNTLKFKDLNETPLFQAWESKSNDAYLASKNDTDLDAKRAHLRDALTYSRALDKLKPGDLNYRFNVGYVLYDLGEHDAAQAIMDELAPQDKNGFSKAHLWHADRLLAPDRPLTPENLNAAEAHLLRALATHPEPEEVHRRLGELYYFRYVRYKQPPDGDVVVAREKYLAMSEEQLSKVKPADPKLVLMLAEIRALRGQTQQAEADVRALIDDLNKQLREVPDDLKKRLYLAQSYRMVREFDLAAEVLEQGLQLRQDARIAQELGNIHFFKALDLKQRVPNSLQKQFEAISKAYMAFPTNNYIAHRFVQALTSADNKEIETARETLQKLVDAKAPGQMAPLLLGFDYTRRKLPEKAETYLELVRAAEPDKTSEIIAGLTTAVLNGQVKSLKPLDAHELFELSRRVWPNDPDLLVVRAQQNLMLKDYAKALVDLNKALEGRPKDAKINEMLAVTYDHLGQADTARKHRDAAEAARINTPVPQP
jgi:tetratricopeptide (TPR) repeat protein